MEPKRPSPERPASSLPFYLRQVSPLRGVSYVIGFVVVTVALLWLLTGDGWRAVALTVAGLFVLLFALAIHFWGTMVIGGTLTSLFRQRSPVPWALDGASPDVPEHDLDPGLELLGAGVLVYRIGQVRPTVHFRDVPLTEARAVRPFVVARTGATGPYQFEFALEDEAQIARFEQQFTHDLQSRPQLVMPRCLLTFPAAQRLVGQRWTLHVRCGVTVVTSLRVTFVNTRNGAGPAVNPAVSGSAGDELLEWRHQLLPRLLDEAIKQDALSLVPQVVVEDR